MQLFIAYRKFNTKVIRFLFKKTLETNFYTYICREYRIIIHNNRKNEKESQPAASYQRDHYQYTRRQPGRTIATIIGKWL